MYNKLFTKILDSSVWLESTETRIVWITMLAAMDQDGFVALSAPGNVAARARLTLPEAEKAIAVLEAPDKYDPTQDHEGRRIERVPYGWTVLNAGKYRDLFKAEIAREQTRTRVAKYRARVASNADVTHANDRVTQSETTTEATATASTETSATAVEKRARKRVAPRPAAAPVAEVQVQWPAILDTDEIRRAFAAWASERPKGARRVTPQLMEAKLAQLLPLGPERALAALRHSTGYQGIFEAGGGAGTAKGGQYKTKADRVTDSVRALAEFAASPKGSEPI